MDQGDQGAQHVCASFYCWNAWICAQRTTDRDLASVIPDKNESKRDREECTFVTVVNIADLTFFELISPVRIIYVIFSYEMFLN